VRIRRVAGRQASRPLLIGLKVGRTLKKTFMFFNLLLVFMIFVTPRDCCIQIRLAAWP